MSMLNKDELIEKMARKILDAAMYSEHPDRRAALFESEKPYWTDCAKAALNALLDNLPEPIDGYQNIHDTYYRKLLAMRGK